MKKMLKNFFSIDERQISTLVISLMTMIVFTMVQYTIYKDITTNLKEIVITLILSVAGVNGAESIKGIFNKNTGNGGE